MFEYVLFKHSRSDFIERLFYYQSHGKMEKYRHFHIYGGWQKLIALPGNAANHIADSSTHQLKNLTMSKFSKSQQNQAKSQFPHPEPLIVPHIVKTH